MTRSWLNNLCCLCRSRSCAPMRQAPPPSPSSPKITTSPPRSTQRSSRISAIAKIDFIAHEVSTGIRVELQPKSRFKDVKTADGKTLNFERDIRQHTLRHRLPFRNRRRRHKSHAHLHVRGPARQRRKQPRPRPSHRRHQAGRRIISCSPRAGSRSPTTLEPLQRHLPSQRSR